LHELASKFDAKKLAPDSCTSFLSLCQSCKCCRVSTSVSWSPSNEYLFIFLQVCRHCLLSVHRAQ